MLTVETDGTEEAKTKIITVYPSQWWKETVPNNIPYFRDLPRKRSSSLENFAFEFFSKERRKRKGKREKKRKEATFKNPQTVVSRDRKARNSRGRGKNNRAIALPPLPFHRSAVKLDPPLSPLPLQAKLEKWRGI